MKASDITTLESLLEAWFNAHPGSEVTFYRLSKTVESPRVCKIAYPIGKGALVLQAPGESHRETFSEVSERVNRTVGRPIPKSGPSDITRRWRD